MEDPRSGVQVGTQNLNFSGKSGTRHEKMGSQTGSGKRVLSWRGQNLKSEDPYTTFSCFLGARTFKIKQKRCTVVQNRRYHRFLEKRRLVRNNRKSKPLRVPRALKKDTKSKRKWTRIAPRTWKSDFWTVPKEARKKGRKKVMRLIDKCGLMGLWSPLRLNKPGPKANQQH